MTHFPHKYAAVMRGLRYDCSAAEGRVDSIAGWRKPSNKSEDYPMSAETLLRLVCHSIFVFVFLVVARRALAAPTKANLHITTLFGVVVLFVVHYWAVQLLELR